MNMLVPSSGALCLSSLSCSQMQPLLLRSVCKLHPVGGLLCSDTQLQPSRPFSSELLPAKVHQPTCFCAMNRCLISLRARALWKLCSEACDESWDGMRCICFVCWYMQACVNAKTFKLVAALVLSLSTLPVMLVSRGSGPGRMLVPKFFRDVPSLPPI